MEFLGLFLTFLLEPCFWLLTDALIVSFTIAAIAAVIDVLLDIGYFLNRVPKDSVPLVVGGDNSYPKKPYKSGVVARIFFALVIRAVSSCFLLLALAAATNLTLVPLPLGNTTSAATAVYPYPPQCGLLSDNVYNYKLFFGFGAIAAIFGLLRIGLVRQSTRLGVESDKKPADVETGVKVPVAAKSEEHDHHDHHEHDHHDNDEQEMEAKGGDDDEEDQDDDDERKERRHRERRRRHRHRKERRDRKREESDEKDSSDDS